MDIVIGKIEIIISKDFVSGNQSIEISTKGPDEEIIFGFAEAMKTNSKIKAIFNQAVKKANADKAQSQN